MHCAIIQDQATARLHLTGKPLFARRHPTVGTGQHGADRFTRVNFPQNVFIVSIRDHGGGTGAGCFGRRTHLSLHTTAPQAAAGTGHGYERSLSGNCFGHKLRVLVNSRVRSV